MRVNWVLAYVAALVMATAATVCVTIFVMATRPSETDRRVDGALKVFQMEQRRLEELRDWLLAEPEVRGLIVTEESSLVVTVLDQHRGRNVQWSPQLDMDSESQWMPAAISDPSRFLNGLSVAKSFLCRIGAHDCMQNPRQYDNGAVGRFGVRVFPRSPGIPSVFLVWIPEDVFVNAELVEILDKSTHDWSRKNPHAQSSIREIADGWHILLEWD